jgi:hypothetical protein
VPLIVEVKVIIPQQNAFVQSYEIMNEFTVIGVVGGLGVGLVVGGVGVLVGVGLVVGGLGVGLVDIGIALIVFRVTKRSRIIRITATANIEVAIIRSVLLELDSDIFIIALAVRKLKIFSDKTNNKSCQGRRQNDYNPLF